MCALALVLTDAAWTTRLCAWSVTADAQPAGGTLTGVATAADGARLPGVSLTLLDPDGALAARVISSEGGLFRLAGLPAGRYLLRAELDGFEPRQVPDLEIGAGQTITVTVRLEVATVREMLRVVGVAPHDTIELIEIRESRARDVGEALTALPGMNRIRKGAIANDVVLRGFRGKDVTVLIDGQRIDGACPGHMDPPAFHVDFAEVGRLEVSKGPFDVRNQGGLAGVVNVVTQRPRVGWHASANLFAASAGTRSASGAASIGRENLALLGGVSARRADPYGDGDGISLLTRGNYRRDLSSQLAAYDVWTAWGRAVVSPRAGTLLHLSYSRQSADTIVYPYLQMDALFDNADRVGARFELAELPRGWGALATSVYLTAVDHWMTDEYRTSAVGMPRAYSMATRAKTRIAGARAELQRGGLAVGFEASRREWDSRTFLAGRQYVPQSPLPDATINVAGAFGAYAVEIGSSWRVEAGGRLDSVLSDVDRSRANTSVYLAYHGTDDTHASDLLPVGYARATWRHHGWTVTGGVGHAARAPDQQERYYALQRMGTDWVGNPRLEPSRNTGSDGALRYTQGGWEAGIAAFHYRVDDHLTVVEQPRLAAVPGVMNRLARSYANVDATISGLEANATLPLSAVLFLSADASTVRGRTRQDWPTGPNLPEMSPARARLRLRFDNARWHVAGELVGVAGQDDVVAALGETATPGFAILSLRGGFRLKRLDLLAAVDNLLDTLYAEHLSYQRDPFRIGTRVYEPGRTLSIGLGTRF